MPTAPGSRLTSLNFNYFLSFSLCLLPMHSETHGKWNSASSLSLSHFPLKTGLLLVLGLPLEGEGGYWMWEKCIASLFSK